MAALLVLAGLAISNAQTELTLGQTGPLRLVLATDRVEAPTIEAVRRLKSLVELKDRAPELDLVVIESAGTVFAYPTDVMGLRSRAQYTLALKRIEALLVHGSLIDTSLLSAQDKQTIKEQLTSAIGGSVGRYVESGLKFSLTMDRGLRLDDGSRQAQAYVLPRPPLYNEEDFKNRFEKPNASDAVPPTQLETSSNQIAFHFVGRWRTIDKCLATEELAKTLVDRLKEVETERKAAEEATLARLRDLLKSQIGTAQPTLGDDFTNLDRALRESIEADFVQNFAHHGFGSASDAQLFLARSKVSGWKDTIMISITYEDTASGLTTNVMVPLASPGTS